MVTLGKSYQTIFLKPKLNSALSHTNQSHNLTRINNINRINNSNTTARLDTQAEGLFILCVPLQKSDFERYFFFFNLKTDDALVIVAIFRMKHDF